MVSWPNCGGIAAKKSNNSNKIHFNTITYFPYINTDQLSVTVQLQNQRSMRVCDSGCLRPQSVHSSGRPAAWLSKAPADRRTDCPAGVCRPTDGDGPTTEIWMENLRCHSWETWVALCYKLIAENSSWQLWELRNAQESLSDMVWVSS